MSKTIVPVSQDQCPEHLRTNRSALRAGLGVPFIVALLAGALEGSIADAERLLVVAAPHTSPTGILSMASLPYLGINARVRWLGKHTIF